MYAVILSGSDLRASRSYLYLPCPVHLAARAAGYRGVSYQDGQLRFDRDIHTEETAQLLVASLKGLPLQLSEQLAMVGLGERTEPTKADMDLINKHYNGDALEAKDVVVFQDWALSNADVRRPVRFTRGYLEAIVPSFKAGRTVLLHHRETYGVGWTFDADVTRATVRGVEADWVRAKWYSVIRNATPERLQQIEDVRSIYKHVSITAAGGDWQWQEVEGPNGKEHFYLVDASETAEAAELSRVYLGAVHGAGDNKLSARDTDPSPEPEPTSPTTKSQDLICVF